MLAPLMVRFSSILKIFLDEEPFCEIDGLQITILEVSDNMIKQAKVEKLAS